MTAPVVINARAAARAEIGGVERVAVELASALPELKPERYRVVRPPAALAHRAGQAWEQALLPLAARGASLILCPANLAPVVSRRNVVVIHDLAPLAEPDSYTGAYGAWHRRVIPVLARRARRVITVSEFSKRELVERLGLAPDAIRVAPPGVDAGFNPGADPAPAGARYGLERPYVLTVGSRITRKNLGVLAEAARRLGEHGIDLVAAGSGRGYMRPGEMGGARPLGYVADEHLPGLYAGALALVLPSLYEGFGLPCLEGMACATPVVAANAAALPETCADAALLVDPRDPAGMADAVLAAATDESVRARLQTAGPARAATFTWQRTAGLTDAAIGELLA